MLPQQAHIGMKVYFGRHQGEKTLAKIIKCNPAKAQVETLEERGRGRGSYVGAVWNVPYSLLTPAEGEVSISVGLEFNQFQLAAEQHILQAIACTYGELSPENLSADGELPMSRVRARSSELHRRLKGLFVAFGREVSETEVYDWDRKRRDFEFRPK